MKQATLKPLLQAIGIILVFLITVTIYFSPVLDDKALNQHDVEQYNGMSKELNDYRDQNGEEALWTNSMFSGMPAYLISTTYDNLIKYTFVPIHNNKDNPHMLAFMYFLCFFIALLLFDISIWLSMLGALFFGFSSYFFIIIEAGHITKAIALSYMPVVITAAYATYKGKHWLGATVFSLFLGLQILINHLQITYYTALVIFIFACFQAYHAYKTKAFMAKFIKPSLYLIVAVMLAVGSNFASLYLTYDYGQDSMRGKSELTHDQHDKTGGLDKSYATSYSYGITETFNLISPNYKGGASGTKLDEESETYKAFINTGYPAYVAEDYTNRFPTYWGNQESTSGPVYIGALVFFLFVLGLFIVKGVLKWSLLTATIFAIMIAWGENFMLLVEPMLDYFPGFNKFRTISMILVIPQFTMPLLAVLGLQKIFSNTISKEELFDKLKKSLYIAGGLILLLIITGGLYDFNRAGDGFPDWLVKAVRADRKSMMYADLWRSLFFIVVGFALIAAYHFKKLKMSAVIGLLAVFTIFDLWSVNKRYLNDDDFKDVVENQNSFALQEVDKQILQDTSYYRVANASPAIMADAITSYHHKSIGGYHGAKMKRYQELVDTILWKQLSPLMSVSQQVQETAKAQLQEIEKSGNPQGVKLADIMSFKLQQFAPQLDSYLSSAYILNMLNTKYFIVNNQIQPIVNRHNFGNAWFVNKVSIVPNADAEIGDVVKINPHFNAVVDARFKDLISDTVLITRSNPHISLTHYAPNELRYTSSNKDKGIAIFSEIYYSKGWNAYIDGELVPHFRADYVLRGLEIPAGDHEIIFKFEPKMYAIGNTISLIASTILVLLLIAAIVFEIKKKLKAQDDVSQEKITE